MKRRELSRMHTHPSDPSGPPQPLQHLLIGQREEDYFIIQDLLRTNGRVLAASLDQASSFADAQTRLTRKSYDLLLLEHESSEDEALQILRELRLRNQTTPCLFLTEYADEATIAEIVQAGSCECVSRVELNRASLLRAIRSVRKLVPQ